MLGAYKDLPKGGVFLCCLVISLGVHALLFGVFDLAARITMFALSFLIFCLGWVALASMTMHARKKRESR
jgi:hypothetical protein